MIYHRKFAGCSHDNLQREIEISLNFHLMQAATNEALPDIQTASVSQDVRRDIGVIWLKNIQQMQG